MNPKRRCRRNVEKEITADLDSQRFNSTCIPDDVIAEILSRLPIKSIGRLMSVSKNWRDIIKSRSFFATYAKNKPCSTFYATSRNYHSWYRGQMVDVSENGTCVSTTVKSRSAREAGFNTQIVGSCNGLLCFLESTMGIETIGILNPITEESTVTLPNHDDWVVRRPHKAVKKFYGFGYSPSTDEYKVLKGSSVARGGEVRDSYAICTVGVDKRWRKLSPDLFPDKRMPDKVGHCNGAFHWLVIDDDKHDDPSHSYILAFDIVRENTRRVPIPHRIDRQHLELLVLNDRLCLFRSLGEQGRVGTAIWKMEDYGDDGSWSDEILVPLIRVRKAHMIFTMLIASFDHDYEQDIFVPVDCGTKCGGILFRSREWRERALVLYCPKQKTHITLRFPHDGKMLFEFTPNFSSINEIIYGNRVM